jgi:AbiTii
VSIHEDGPQAEATTILSEVLASLTFPPPRDLQSIMRRCYTVCQMLGWDDWQDWFHHELTGYPNVESVPSYRQITGRAVWRPSAGLHVALEKAVEDQFSTEPEDPGEPITYTFWAGLPRMLRAASSGSRDPTDEEKEEFLRYRGKSITMKKVRVFDAASFGAVVQIIENETYRFASEKYVLLKYGNLLTDIWQDYRRDVDAVLQRLNMTRHWQAIQSGLLGDNPEGWRNAAFGCRNLLNDVAGHLWRDKRKTYELLKDPDGKPIEVTAERFANRLAAYAHQKGLTGTSGKFLRDEVERLAASIRSLIGYQSEAHQSIDRERARSIALATYVILGELATRTDMEPIEKYRKPN